MMHLQYRFYMKIKTEPKHQTRCCCSLCLTQPTFHNVPYASGLMGSRCWWRDIPQYLFSLSLTLSAPPSLFPTSLSLISSGENLCSFLHTSLPFSSPLPAYLTLLYPIFFFSHHQCAVPTPGRGDLQPQLDSAMQDVTDMCLLMEETEKQAVRRALVEERGRFCTFIGFLQPVVVRRWRWRGL